jgi:hypothetical protein
VKDRSAPEGAPRSASTANRAQFNSRSPLERYISGRERVLGRGRRLWLANALLDANNDDIFAAIDDLKTAFAMRGAA